MFLWAGYFLKYHSELQFVILYTHLNVFKHNLNHIYFILFCITPSGFLEISVGFNLQEAEGIVFDRRIRG